MLRLLGDTPLRRLLLEAAVFALVVKGAELAAAVQHAVDDALRQPPEAKPAPERAEEP